MADADGNTAHGTLAAVGAVEGGAGRESDRREGWGSQVLYHEDCVRDTSG